MSEIKKELKEAKKELFVVSKDSVLAHAKVMGITALAALIPMSVCAGFKASAQKRLLELTTEDTYLEETTQEISEIIPVEHFETDFEKLAATEGLIAKEELSKYIILDTGDVLPEGTEENTIDTKTLPTLYLNQTLRSGQTVNYGGNILIIGDAHPGSEIIAEGDITVWGILGGIAHAGYKGNITSKVRALKLNAIQLRIAGLYARRNDTLNVPYVQKTNEFTPEEAQIEEGKIVIYKKLRRD